MENRHSRINISAPNLANVCVDESRNGEISGRIYHCYDREPIYFSNVIELLGQLECFYDSISFPQASTKSRYFIEPAPREKKVMEKVVNQKDLLQYSGRIGTFVTHVQYRQNSDWQGRLVWMERDVAQSFASVLEFLKLINNALAGYEWHA